MSLSNEALHDAYRTMRTIREFEERINAEFVSGDIPGFVHLYAGEEAIAAGVCAHLKKSDYIGSTHRGHGHCIAKGCDPKAMMKEIYGKRDGLCGGKGGSMHIADLEKGMLGANAIVGGSPPLAIGAALSAKSRGQGAVAVAFIGDGASNQGTTFEALNMAVVLKLPCIFVFENNGYGEGTGVSYHLGSQNIAARAGAMGLPAEKVDGTDFFSVEAAAAKAIERARKGEGPGAIEAAAMRFHGHFVGDPQAYRSQDELARLRTHEDCLLKFRERVTADGTIGTAALDTVDAEVATLIDDAVREANASPFPDLADLTTDVYVSY